MYSLKREIDFITVFICGNKYIFDSSMWIPTNFAYQSGRWFTVGLKSDWENTDSMLHLDYIT